MYLIFGLYHYFRCVHSSHPDLTTLMTSLDLTTLMMALHLTTLMIALHLTTLMIALHLTTLMIALHLTTLMIALHLMVLTLLTGSQTVGHFPYQFVLDLNMKVLVISLLSCNKNFLLHNIQYFIRGDSFYIYLHLFRCDSINIKTSTVV